MTACDSDDTGGGSTDLLDGSADARKSVPESGGFDAPYNPPSDSGHEAGPDSGNDAGSDADASSDHDADAATQSDADASSNSDADAGQKPTSVDDATYKITAWTCKGTTDVLAFAASANIGEIDLTVGATSKLDVHFSGGDCVRSNAVVLTYPEAGKVTTTSNAADTCSGTCNTSQCDVSKVEPVLIDTFDYTKNASSFTATRSFPADHGGTLAGLAGCAEGDTESVTYTKK